MKYKELSQQEEEIGKTIVNAAFKIHKELGPGLLEKVYEALVRLEDKGYVWLTNSEKQVMR